MMMATADQNYRLLKEIDANRSFLLMAYRDNPALLERAELRIRQLFAFRAAPASDTLVDALTARENAGSSAP